ncbi:MAG: hypothetical protein EpisKO_00430 [Epibacterium sp.]
MLNAPFYSENDRSFEAVGVVQNSACERNQSSYCWISNQEDCAPVCNSMETPPFSARWSDFP